MKYYIIAGEASGDLHGSNLIKALKAKDSEAVFRGWGGDLMEESGMQLVRHIRDLAFMGFIEVLFNLPTILKNIRLCKKDILEFHPDAVILIDYPGFNLRISKFLHKEGIKNYYYISPQIWAWKQSRVHQIKKHVSRMFVILPFEKAFYAKFGMEVDFVGHPLIDALEQEALGFNEVRFRERNHLGDKNIIALLPGSRRQEIKKMLPVMVQLQNDFPDYQLIIAGAPNIEDDFYQKLSKGFDIPILKKQTHQLIRTARAAAVTSGTASLETALLECPEVICYKGNYFSYQIARRIIHIKYIGLPNLILDKAMIRELIQQEFNYPALKEEMQKLLNPGTYRNQMLEECKRLQQELGGSGASANTAELIINEIKK